jgi:RNA polymerase sigma-70 factor (ECF subfamily)
MSDPGLATAALVAAARNKDEAALQQLLVRNLPGLEAFVRLRMGAALRGLMTAPDLVQSVCREVLEDLGDFEFRGEGPFRHWLFVRAENKLREKHRYHHRDKRDQQKAVSLSEGTNAITGYRTLLTPSKDLDCRRRCGASRPRSTSCPRTTARP